MYTQPQQAYPAQMPYGMGLAPQPQQYNAYVQPVNSLNNLLRVRNPIGEDGYKLLKSKGGGKLNMYASREEILRMLCTHRHNGEFSLVREGNADENVFRCTICDTLIDLGTVYDIKTIENCIAYLTAWFNQMKCKNTGVVSTEILEDMSHAFVLLQRIPTVAKTVDDNFKNNQTGAQQIFTGYNQTANQVMNAITGTGGIPYNPVYSGPQVPILQSQLITNPFAGPIMPAPQPVYQQPVVYQAAYPQQQPVYVQQQQPVYPQQQQVVYPQQQPVYPQQQQPVYPQQQQQMVYPQQQQMAPPPAAAGTVVPEQATYSPPQSQGGNKQSEPGKISKVFGQ